MNKIIINLATTVKKSIIGCLIIAASFTDLQAQTAMGAWNPVLYPAVTGTPGWEVQDNNATGSNSDPFASWSRTVQEIEAGGTNQVITILPDAFIESFDYDNDGNAESTLGHNLATELNITSAHNGLSINGSPEGCYTVFDNTANGAGSLFGTITDADNITVKGLYLLNGYSGAFNIIGSTNVTFEDCVFDNNDLATSVFGIVAGSESSITFTRCQFINNNHASIVHNINRNSGNGPLDLTFTDCVWSCNSATSGGTAMKVTNGGNAGITMNFMGCTFAGNTTTGSQGGAIWFDGSESVTTFMNTNFINNSTSGSNGGGAIFIGTNENITMTGCNFYGNSSTNSSADGGAISVFAGSSGPAILNIIDATFDNNSSGDDGGAISLRTVTAILDNINVLNNNAGDGVITTANSSANLTISNYTCGANSAPDGCIYQRSGSITDNGGTATGSPVDLSAIALDYDCGVYCAIEVPSVCTSVSRGSAICAAPGVIDLSGEVWEDINGNGIQEPGDNGIANAFVLLYDSNANLIGRTNADGAGMYSFVDLPAGFYYIVFTNPDTVAHPNVAPANAGTETTDSDITNPITNATDLFSATNTDVDGAFTNVVLPVELVHFTGKEQANTVQLDWITDNERNNEGFAIERKNNTEWEEIGYVKGSGNTDSERTYAFSDTHPMEGNNQYRLKQIDFDGQFSYSSIVSVLFSKVDNSLIFYPNPVKNTLSLSTESTTTGTGTLEVFDFSGKLIYSLNLSFSNGFNQISLNASDWQSGVYFAKLLLPNGEQRIGKVVKK